MAGATTSGTTARTFAENITCEPLNESGSVMALAPDHTLSDRLRRMVGTIVDEVDPVRIVLFGSQARGDVDDTSDVDLLIVVEEPFQNGRERADMMTRLWRVLSDIRGPKDLLVYSLDEIEKWREAPNHVIARALREGEVLHER